MKEVIDKRELMTHIANCMVDSQLADGDERQIEVAHKKVMDYIIGCSFPEPDRFIHTKCPKCHGYVNPLLTVDIIVWSDGGIVLVKRKNPPYGWALPGGFVDVGETLRQAAKRELREETGLEVDGLGFFYVYDDPKRDPRFHTMSAVFVGSASIESVLKAGDDAADVKVFQTTNIPELVFDHRTILNDYFGVRRKR